jgi:hypothetical protein
MTKTGQQNKTNFDFKLTGIELVNSNLFNPGVAIEKQIFHFNIKIEQKINLEKKLIIVTPEIEIQQENKKTTLGTIKVACIFYVTNLDEFKVEEGDLVSLPNEIITMLNSISLSTTRGVMFSQFKGTFLHNAFLPIIDPKTFNSIKPN